MDDNKNKLEEFFNKSIDEFNTPPSNDVWEGIEVRLDEDISFFTKWANWLKLLIPATILLVVFGLYQYQSQQKIEALSNDLQNIQNEYDTINERLNQISNSSKGNLVDNNEGTTIIEDSITVNNQKNTDKTTENTLLSTTESTETKKEKEKKKKRNRAKESTKSNKNSVKTSFKSNKNKSKNANERAKNPVFSPDIDSDEKHSHNEQEKVHGSQQRNSIISDKLTFIGLDFSRDGRFWNKLKQGKDKAKGFFSDKFNKVSVMVDKLPSINQIKIEHRPQKISQPKSRSISNEIPKSEDSGKYKIGFSFRTITSFADNSEEFAASYSFGIQQYYRINKLLAITNAFHYNSQFYFVNSPSEFLTENELKGYPLANEMAGNATMLKVHSHYVDAQLGLRFNLFTSKRGFSIFATPSFVGQLYTSQDFIYKTLLTNVNHSEGGGKFYFGSGNFHIGVERRIAKSKLHWQLGFWTEHSFSPLGIEQKHIHTFGGSASILFGK